MKRINQTNFEFNLIRQNQSFSFKMLNKWISDSESTPIQLRSKKDEEEEQQQQQQQAAIRKSEGIFYFIY